MSNQTLYIAQVFYKNGKPKGRTLVCESREQAAQEIFARFPNEKRCSTCVAVRNAVGDLYIPSHWDIRSHAR